MHRPGRPKRARFGLSLPFQFWLKINQAMPNTNPREPTAARRRPHAAAPQGEPAPIFSRQAAPAAAILQRLKEPKNTPHTPPARRQTRRMWPSGDANQFRQPRREAPDGRAHRGRTSWRSARPMTILSKRRPCGAASDAHAGQMAPKTEEEKALCLKRPCRHIEHFTATAARAAAPTPKKARTHDYARHTGRHGLRGARERRLYRPVSGWQPYADGPWARCW